MCVWLDLYLKFLFHVLNFDFDFYDTFHLHNIKFPSSFENWKETPSIAYQSNNTYSIS